MQPAKFVLEVSRRSVLTQFFPTRVQCTQLSAAWQLIRWFAKALVVAMGVGVQLIQGHCTCCCMHIITIGRSVHSPGFQSRWLHTSVAMFTNLEHDSCIVSNAMLQTISMGGPRGGGKWFGFPKEQRRLIDYWHVCIAPQCCCGWCVLMCCVPHCVCQSSLSICCRFVLIGPVGMEVGLPGSCISCVGGMSDIRLCCQGLHGQLLVSDVSETSDWVSGMS